MNITDISRVCVAGAGGRMGQMLVEAVCQASDCQLCGALDLPESPVIGSDAATSFGAVSGVLVTSDLPTALGQADVLIDYTHPKGTLAHLSVCRELGVNMVIGTTGLTEAQKDMVRLASKDIAVVMAPNMSVGVNVTLKLLDIAARLLSTGYDIEIIEMHHRHKVDAPSGTALKMGEVIAHALGRELQECAVYARHGMVGERSPSIIGFSTIRGGDIVGDHTVLFAGTGERITISHQSNSRVSYAQGSLRAVRFLRGHDCGLFDMADVLGLR